MRYFLLLARPVTSLPGGIVDATGPRGLVLCAGSFNRCFSGRLAATTGAITLTAITAAADDDLRVATTTVVETAG